MHYLPPAMGHGQRAAYHATQGAARLGDIMSKLRNLDVGGSADVLLGNDFNTQRRLTQDLEKMLGAPANLMPNTPSPKPGISAGVTKVNPYGMSEKYRHLVSRGLRSKVGQTALRFAPVTAAGFALSDVASLVTDDVSLANKAMDATAMGIGGFLGSVGGPIGTAAGISTGKFLSDTTQAIFGGGKSREQQEREQLYKLLLSRGL